VALLPEFLSSDLDLDLFLCWVPGGVNDLDLDLILRRGAISRLTGDNDRDPDLILLRGEEAFGSDKDRERERTLRRVFDSLDEDLDLSILPLFCLCRL